MFKSKLTKLGIASGLSLTMIMSMGVFAKAVVTRPDGGTWNRDLVDGHNGYYMAYSYYYHPSKTHYSWARLSRNSTGNKWAPAGSTSIANTNSLKSTDWNAGYGF